MSLFILIRHGHTEMLGKRISGRMAGVHLSEKGREQVAELCRRLLRVKIEAVYSSPLERAWETAEALASCHGLSVRACPELNEIDFGEWAGQTLAELEVDPRWRTFNTFRSGTRAPGGEMMVEAQARAVAGLDRLRQAHGNGTLALVSHGDVIRGLIWHFAGIPLDLGLRVTLSPCSVSGLEIGEGWVRLHCVNETGRLEEVLKER